MGRIMDASAALGTRARRAALKLAAVVCATAALPALAQAPAASSNLNPIVVTPSRNAAPATQLAPGGIRRGSLDLKLDSVVPAAASVGGIGGVTSAPLPLRTPPPHYPHDALADQVSGSVTLAFTVYPDGSTGAIRVVSSNPPGVFDHAARAAVRDWRFRPALQAGRPVARTVTQTLEFRPPPGSGRKPPPQPAKPEAVPHDSVPANIHPVRIVPPAYPPVAYRQGLAGSVTLRFVVTADGRTRDIRVLAAHPHGVFDAAAIAAVRQWRFEPVAQPTPVVQTIAFKPGGG